MFYLGTTQLLLHIGPMKRIHLPTCITLLFLSVCTCFLLSPNEPAAVTDTDCGKVQGVWDNDGHAFEFRGIPYAVPPVGALRWERTVPVAQNMGNCWNGTYMATSFGNDCYQRHALNISKYLGDEDCLYLNVWTPDLNQSAELPVMFWIHGGYLLNGNGHQQDIGYAPTSKLAHDTGMVYVSINYRLQAFGFMALEWLTDKSPYNTSGNYGFMDMIAGLQWVQRNIRMFGGNPSQVTVFGQSSGGTSLYALLGSPLCRGLFHKAWVLSASPVLNKTASEAFKDNEVFVRNTNCTDVACLYRLSAHDVTSSVPWDVYPNWQMADLLALPEKGHFDGALAIVDGYVLPEAPMEAWVHGRGVDVPVIIGSTAQETDLIPEPVTAANWTSDQYEQHVRKVLGTFGADIAEIALKLYASAGTSPEYQFTTMTTDARVTCASDYLCLVAATSFSSPVYRYVTTYFPSRPVSLFGIDYPVRYSAHGVDVFAFFRSFQKFMKSSQAELEWENNVQREILAFIKTGKPATSAWSPYPASTALLSVNTTVVHQYHAAECEFWLANGFFSYGWIN